MARMIIETTDQKRNTLKSEAAKRGMTLKDFMIIAAEEKINREKAVK